MAGNFEGIKTRKFGIEIEMTGLTRCQAAKALSKILGGEVVHEGGTYDKYTVRDHNNRDWSVVYDGSINCYNAIRVWLLNLWLIGDEFKNCRTHLLKHLEGDIAWRHPEDGIAARAKLKEKRELEKQAASERRAEPVNNNSTQAENVPEENNEPTESQCEGVEEELEMSM